MIFYLSCTGNSFWAADIVAKEIGDTLVSVIDADKSDYRFSLAKNERIGFVFPVHGWRPPKIMRRFIAKLAFDNIFTDHYCYAIVTAGDNIGETINIFENDLKKRNIHLDAAFSLIMPESYVGLPLMDVDTIEKERQKKERSAKRLREYIEYIEERKCVRKNLDIGRWPRLNSRVIGGFFTKFLISDKPFRVVEDRCVKCGLCADICPVNDVQGGKGKLPEWKHNGDCMTCFACYHHCPNHAIEFGHRTKDKGQYYFNKNKL